MKIDEFVVEKNPGNLSGDNTVGFMETLDIMILDPMERELIRLNLEEMMKKRKKALPYKPDLVMDFIKFYKENPYKPLGIEVLGSDRDMVETLTGKLIEVLAGLQFTTMLYVPDLNAPFKNGIAAIATETLTAAGIMLGQYLDNNHVYIKNLATMLIEYIGCISDESHKYIFCVLYDRFHYMHGYVAFKV